jgi:plastocyanin
MHHATCAAIRRARLFGAIGAVLLLAASCGGGAPEQPATPAVTTNPVDPATAGTVAGTIVLQGSAPAATPINMATDPYCESQGGSTVNDYATGTGGSLGNVFVYVKDGLGDLKFPVPSTPAVLDQKGCVYLPHVLGLQVGQTLEIRNSDSTLHNMHATPENNREFNKALNLQGLNHTHTFSTAEVMIPFKCDVHRWMRSYVGVLPHPFFAVTGTDGAFRLTGLPPGTYTVEAWHEKLGRQTQSVTIGPREAKDVSFAFKI